MSDFEKEISELLNSDRCESAFKEINSKFDTILSLALPFKDDVAVRQYRNRLYGGFDYNDISTQQALNKYETLKPDLIDRVVQCCNVAAKEVEKIFGLLPFSLTQPQIKKYVVEKEKERYQWHVRPSGPDKYGIYFMMPETLNRIGQEYFRYILPYYISAMRDAIKSKQRKAIQEKEKASADKVISSTKVLLIFDYDGTVFNTDGLRRARNKKQVKKEDLLKIDYIEGFNDIFLNPKSRLYLERFNVLGITSSYTDYYRTLLDNHGEFSRLVNMGTIRSSEKLASLRKFFTEHKGEFEEVIAFGDDDKDALVYSKLGLKYYIVNNYYGYEPKVEDILNIAIKNQKYNFRRNYLHDVKTVTFSRYNLRYFDDIVVYYKNYLDTLRFDEEAGVERGSNYSPSQGNLKPLRVYKARNEMGKFSKNEYILNHLDSIAALFDDLPLDKNSVLVCIPGHAETKIDYSKPMFKLLQRIASRHNIPMISDGVLYRTKETEESKDGSRSIDKHLESIGITEAGKKAIKGRNVYLFDDIVTSGSSMMACSQILYHYHAGHVVCVCIARTCGDGNFAPTEIK